MSRSFEVCAESPASVEQVHSAFGDQDYWSARFAAFGGNFTLDTLTVEADGTVIVAATQGLRHDLLPAVIAKVMPGDLRIRHSETWRPIGDRQVRGEVSIAALGELGSGVGSALLAPAWNGSRLGLTATVAVKIPLVGGRIESYLGGQLAEHVPAVQRFTTQWIAGRV